MNVSLSPELEQFLDEKVKSGKFQSPSEVINEALRLLEERERSQMARLDKLKAKIRVGIEELDRGEGIDGDLVFAELEDDIQRIETEMQQTQEAK